MDFFTSNIQHLTPKRESVSHEILTLCHATLCSRGRGPFFERVALRDNDRSRIGLLVHGPAPWKGPFGKHLF